MPHDTHTQSGADLIRAAAETHGQLPLVSSFGAESVVLLHMVAQIDPDWPVLFLDTHMLFPETLDYQLRASAQMGLRNVIRLRPDPIQLALRDPDGQLHLTDNNACCDLRKTQPLDAALDAYPGWITGRKRFQSGRRATLPLIEEDNGKIKLNPLADWTPADITTYFEAHALPRHPLVARGFPSIGCAPCTSAVAPGEDPRAGRWRGSEKDECGIHIVDGKVVRPQPMEKAS